MARLKLSLAERAYQPDRSPSSAHGRPSAFSTAARMRLYEYRSASLIRERKGGAGKFRLVEGFDPAAHVIDIFAE